MERTTMSVSAHTVIPEVVFCAGCSLRALGVDLDLFVEGILVQSGGGVQKSRPPFQTARDLSGCPRRQLSVQLNFVWHLAWSSFLGIHNLFTLS